jgi:hypothetical protein
MGESPCSSGLAGFADGLVAALNPLETFLPVPKIGPVYGHSTAYLAGNIAGTVAGMVAPMLLTAGASSSLLLTKAIGVMDKVGNVADVAGLVWDVGSTMLSTPGGEGVGDLSGLDLFGPDGSDEAECFIVPASRTHRTTSFAFADRPSRPTLCSNPGRCTGRQAGLAISAHPSTIHLAPPARHPSRPHDPVNTPPRTSNPTTSPTPNLARHAPARQPRHPPGRMGLRQVSSRKEKAM